MYINKKVVVLLIVLISLILIVFFGYKKTTGVNYKKEMTTDFNFLAKVYHDTYTIDTYSNTLTKLIDWESDTIITFHVSNEFREKIYHILRDIDIYKYPKNYAPTSTIRVSPSSSYYLKFTIDSDTTVINWTENTESEKKDAKKLRYLFSTIYDYLEQDERIKALPDSKRAFL